ncbi:MAG: transglycosylase domain-containing protein [Saprospiraceae bacterium]|nr:transglycosylase domain-containing protein [Saprospiraceae bacterium]
MSKSLKSSSTSTKFLGGHLKLMLYGILISLFLVCLMFFIIAKTLLPDTEELENPKYEIASDFISSDEQVFGKIFKFNREWLNYSDLNPNLVNALIATEDERFFSHSGIDARGTMRAIFYMGKKGGASTITQQLAKLFFTQRSSSFIRRVWQKLKEWVIAVEFEKRYTKEEILAMYLNKSDFLYDAVGIGAAAKTYFGKDQKQLSIEECAILIGMLKNPRMFNPVLFPDRSFNRRNVVLKQMVRNDFLDEKQYYTTKIKEINMSNFRRQVHFDGLAPYFRMELTKWLKKLLDDEKYRKPDGTRYNPYIDGLKIYTTIDSRVQRYAEQAMFDHMAALQDKYFLRWKNLDPVKYNATKEQIDTRNKALIQMMKESERYKLIKNVHMTQIFSEIVETIDGARLEDTDIFRMFEEKNKPGHLKKLLKSESISQEQMNVYFQILESDKWKTLQSQWNKMQKAVNAAFNTKTKMKVFAYNETMEKTAEMTPMDSIRYHLQHMQIGSVGIDPKTGNILSWVGGIGHKYFQYDHVNSNRQVGSTFKPFLYSTAIINKALSPCYKVQDIQHCILADDANFKLASKWCPSNADRKYSGAHLTLRQALKESKNSISVYLMKEIGNVQSVKDFVGNLGINKDKIENYPSICLGTPELSVMDMAGAYTAFANDGIVSKPIFVTRIEDKNGRLIYSANPEQKRAINKAYNFVIVDMLKFVAQGFAGKKFKSEVAGKTGTTNSYKDGWYVGFTPEIVIATWVGGDQEFIRFNTMGDGQGAVMARPFFEKFLLKLEADNRLGFGNNSVFMRPEEELIETDCSKYENFEQPVDEGEVPRKNSSDFDEDF